LLIQDTQVKFNSYKTILILVFLIVSVYGFSSENSLVGRNLIIGGDFNYPPYEALNKNGIPYGYNIDLTQEVSRIMGFTVDYRLAKWARVRGWLENGEIDLIEGMAASQHRANGVYFSVPHFRTWRAVFYNKKRPFKDLEEIESANIVIQQGDVAEEFLQERNFKGGITYVPTQEDALIMVSNGEFDACVVNYLHGKYIIDHRKLENMAFIEDRILQRDYCFASLDENLINEFNSALAILNKDGTIANLHTKWFAKYDPVIQARNEFIKLWIIVIASIFCLILFAIIVLIILKRRVRFKTKDLITELKNLEKLQVQLRQEYNIFLQGSVVVYKVKQNSLVISYITENVSQLGWSQDEVCGRTDFYENFVHPDDREFMKKRLIKLFTSDPATESTQYRVLTKDGKAVWVMGFSIRYLEETDPDPISDSKRKLVPMVYGHFLDIETQKRIERDLQEARHNAEVANQAKNLFLSKMSHEIRTPLNGILGLAQDLSHNDPSILQEASFKEIIDTTDQMSSLVQNILEFSQMETLKGEQSSVVFDVRELLDSTLRIFVTYHKQILDIRLRINDSVPMLLKGDMLHLKQVLIGLVQNSITMTDKGWIELTLDVYNRTDDDIRLIFCLTDTGIGFDKREQQDFFDSINPNQTLLASKYGRKGLGLSTLRSTVEMMNGFIWVESDKNRGSSYFFIIPFKVESSQVEKSHKSTRISQQAILQIPCMRALIVEDDHINQLVLKRQLEHWNQKVSIVNNGLEALESIKHNVYDYILMDIQMPVMDGIKATREIRSLESGTNIHIPIFAVTAAAMVGDKERFIQAGMDDYIPKPVDSKRLFRLILQVNQRKGPGK